MSLSHRSRGARLASLVVAASAALLTMTPLRTEAASAPTFGSDVVIGKGGGEPSLAIDDFAGSPGLGNLYIDSPSTIKLYTSTNDGIGFNSGVGFDPAGVGGDTDVAVAPGGNVVVTDLDITHAWVQVSADQGATFNTGTATAYEDDRPWLTTAANNVVYVAYHDFAAEVPVVCTSIDGGQTFTSCFQAFGPSQSTSDCAENTIPGRSLAVDPTDGSLNFMYACSTAAQNAGDPPYGPLHDFFLAHSAAVVNGVAPAYTTLPVFQADTASGTKSPVYSSIFSDFRIDSAGNYYALFAGTADDNNVVGNPYHVYLVTSTDHGSHWSGLKQVDIPADAANPGTNVFPDMTVTTPGNVDIAWYHSAFTGEPNGSCGGTVGSTTGTSSCTAAQNPFPPHTAANAPAWNAYFAQSTNALLASPTFTQVVVNSTATHYGQICTNGIVCGSSDRSLLDFLSIQVDCAGLAHIAYPGNDKAEDAGVDIHVANQNGGSPLAPPASCTAAVTVPEAPGEGLLALAGLVALPVAWLIRRRRPIVRLAN